MRSEEHVIGLIPAYALECLELEEELRVAEHLENCEKCRTELASYRRVVDDLPLAMAESSPPPELKAKIMTRARASRQLFQEPVELTWWQRFTQSLRGGAPAWGLVSLVLILVLGASNLFLWGRLNNLESAHQTALMTIPLTGTDFTPKATGMLVVSQDGEHGTLVVDGLPGLDEGYQYQLWLIRDGQRTSGGLFSVSDEGYGSLWVDSPQPLVGYSDFGITIEPAGGSPGPTGDKVLGGQL